MPPPEVLTEREPTRSPRAATARAGPLQSALGMTDGRKGWLVVAAAFTSMLTAFGAVFCPTKRRLVNLGRAAPESWPLAAVDDANVDSVHVRQFVRAGYGALVSSR